MANSFRDGSHTLSSHQKEEEEEQIIRLVDSPEPSIEMNNDDTLKGMKHNLTPQPCRRIEINRPVINQTSLEIDDPNSEQLSHKFWKFLKKKKCSPLGCLYSLIPILYWFPRYNWKQDITYDLTAGFTVAVMHIPQGMAYAQLGNLPPIIGIYMAFFPVIIYSFMGTSRHVSMGTFAVICLMTGKVAAERVSQYNQILPNQNQTEFKYDNNTLTETGVVPIYTTVEIAVALSLCVGLWQVVMGILRMGALSLLLSAEVISGFTTGAAVHVLTSQFKNILGLNNMKGRTGMFKIILTYWDIITNFQTTIANPTPAIVSVITIAVLIIYNEFLKPYVSRNTRFPFPIELFTIIVATGVQKLVNFDVKMVEDIPTGLPAPTLPPISILEDLLIDGLTISIVAYAISISMCKIFATKYNYPLDPNQELIANGTSNIIGSFFSCAPIAVSLSRSLVQELVGGKTQLAGLFSSGIILIVLLWIGPFFETLPNCVLSAIIVVALKGMFLQIFDLPKSWKESILNAFIWILTFLMTVIMDIEYGLATGILLSILILIWRSNKPHIAVLGVFSDLDLYVVNSHMQSKEIPGRKLIKYTGNLNFVTVEYFVKKVERIVPCHKDAVRVGQHENPVFTGQVVNNEKNEPNHMQLEVEEPIIEWVIFDFSSLSSVDPEALKSLMLQYKRYQKENIQFLFAACPPTVLHTMNICKFTTKIGLSNFFPTVHDAVIYCNRSNPSTSAHSHSEILS